MSADSDATSETPAVPGPAAPRWRLPRPKWIAAGIGVVAVAGVVGAYATPRAPEVVRSIDIAAPADAVFALVADLRRLPDWSPRLAADPAAVVLYTGPTDGVGQKMTWTSRLAAVGSGTETVTAIAPDRSVEMAIVAEGQRPTTARFALEADGQKTRVTWGLRTDLGLNPVARYGGLSIDGVVGPDLERGLVRLKALAETPPGT